MVMVGGENDRMIIFQLFIDRWYTQTLGFWYGKDRVHFEERRAFDVKAFDLFILCVVPKRNPDWYLVNVYWRVSYVL